MCVVNSVPGISPQNSHLVALFAHTKWSTCVSAYNGFKSHQKLNIFVVSTGKTEQRQLRIIVFFFLLLLLPVFLKWLLHSSTRSELNTNDLPKNFLTPLQYLSALWYRQGIQETCSLGHFTTVLSKCLIWQKKSKATSFNPRTAFQICKLHNQNASSISFSLLLTAGLNLGLVCSSVFLWCSCQGNPQRTYFESKGFWLLMNMKIRTRQGLYQQSE